MKLMRHHYLAISVTLIICAGMSEIRMSQAGEYAKGYSAHDRHSRSLDNVWRSGTTFNNIRRARYEREGASDNPWQANNNWNFDNPRSREQRRDRNRERNWNNRPVQDDFYERREERYRDRDSRFYDNKSRYENERYTRIRYPLERYSDTSYRDSYDLPRYSFDRIDSNYGYESGPGPDYGSPLITPSLYSGSLYGADPYRASPYGLYPYLRQGGFRPW